MTTTANVFQNYIGGKWQGAQSGQTFPNYNPATGELLGHFPLSGEAEANAAVVAARAAFDKWRLVPAPKRGEILYRVGELLLRRKEEIARTMTQEMGKVLKETRGDVQEGIDMAYYMGGEGRRLFGYSVPVELPNKAGIATRDPWSPASRRGTFPSPSRPGKCSRRSSRAIPSSSSPPAILL